MDAEEEFWSFVNRFPHIARHFEGAQAMRNWISTGRLQYGSKTIIGGPVDWRLNLPRWTALKSIWTLSRRISSG